MRTHLIKTILPVILLTITILFIGSGCGSDPSDPGPQNTCTEGISYKLDGNLISFQNSLVTAEIFNDAAIGKFYDIWTDENNGFYYHSTITETGETAPFIVDWFTTNDVANFISLNNENNVTMIFTIEQGGNAVGDLVNISFSGNYLDNTGASHTITDGLICTNIDILH